jgi:hypothetical protein
MVYNKIPYSTEQGIYLRRTGNFLAANREFQERSGKPARVSRFAGIVITFAATAMAYGRPRCWQLPVTWLSGQGLAPSRALH